jgi:hypothetical protein
MQIIPSSMLPERDEGALRQFLEACRDTARAKGAFSDRKYLAGSKAYCAAGGAAVNLRA